MFAFYCGLETTEATLLVARQQEREGSFRFEGFFDGLTYGLAGRLLFDTASSHAVLSANITAGVLGSIASLEANCLKNEKTCEGLDELRFRILTMYHEPQQGFGFRTPFSPGAAHA